MWAMERLEDIDVTFYYIGISWLLTMDATYSSKVSLALRHALLKIINVFIQKLPIMQYYNSLYISRDLSSSVEYDFCTM